MPWRNDNVLKKRSLCTQVRAPFRFPALLLRQPRRPPLLYKGVGAARRAFAVREHDSSSIIMHHHTSAYITFHHHPS